MLSLVTTLHADPAHVEGSGLGFRQAYVGQPRVLEWPLDGEGCERTCESRNSHV